MDNEADTTARKAFARENLDAVRDEAGVHVVWLDDSAYFVGMSGHTRARMLQHLSGDRQASVLHDKVGRLLDSQLGREASSHEIEEWLGATTFSVEYTTDMARRKAELMEDLKPALNEVVPTHDPRAHAVARPSMPGAGEAPSAGELIERILQLLSERTRGSADPYRADVTRELPAALQAVLPADFVSRGSVGVGSIADVPWAMIVPRGEDPSARNGVYVVLLFAADGSRAYLGLGFGVEAVKGGSKVLAKRALDLRTAIPNTGGWVERVDLGSTLPLPKKYEAATAYAVEYRRGHVPRGAELEQDLLAFISAMTHAHSAGFNAQPDAEPVHLLMKWNLERRPDTIAQHKSIAESKGSVWWGKWGAPGASPISRARLTRIQDQLLEGISTRCYMYRSGELWSTELLEATTDAGHVDADRFPSYYTPSECSLFLRVSEFQPVDTASWATNNLVLVNNPEPAAMPGALSNQTSPLMVFERRQDSTSGVSPEPGTKTALKPKDHTVARSVDLDIRWLAEQTLLDEDWLRDVVEASRRKRQIILAGPPGTSKTWLARLLARYLTQDVPLASRVIQFHASYGYEEFIEGLRPEPSDGGIQFARVDGAVLRMVDQMESGSDQEHVLVLDEMNRANLPRVFGELMYLLEYRDTPADLLYSQDFSLPSNLLFIGTMNTADRSIRSIDLALRRRFEVFELPPSSDVLTRFYASSGSDVSDLVLGFEKLNAKLTDLLDRHHTVGHAFFMEPGFNRQRLEATWTRQLAPLFEEYFFDRPDLAAQLTLEQFWPR